MEGVATCLDSVTIQLCEREAELAGLRGRVRFTSEPTIRLDWDCEGLSEKNKQKERFIV